MNGDQRVNADPNRPGPFVVLRGDADQPLRAECGHCGLDVDVVLCPHMFRQVDWHDADDTTCPGSGARVE